MTDEQVAKVVAGYFYRAFRDAKDASVEFEARMECGEWSAIYNAALDIFIEMVKQHRHQVQGDT